MKKKSGTKAGQRDKAPKSGTVPPKSGRLTQIPRKIRATTFTERLRKITHEGPGAPGMSNAASN